MGHLQHPLRDPGSITKEREEAELETASKGWNGVGLFSGCDIAEVHRTSTQLGLPVSPMEWAGAHEALT